MPQELVTHLMSKDGIDKKSKKSKKYAEIIGFFIEKNILLNIKVENIENRLDTNQAFNFHLIADCSNILLDNNVINNIKSVPIEASQLRCFSFSELNRTIIHKYLLSFNHSHIEIAFNYEPGWEKYVKLIYEKLQPERLVLTRLYNAPENRKAMEGLVLLTTSKLENQSCGLVSTFQFNPFLKFYNISLFQNSCLAGKIAIDEDGNIRNCPSLTESFGNIKNSALANIIESGSFRKYWHITKDKIHVCKDCEFRYICTDCRAYVEDPNDILSKPLKCGYNPYTGEWLEWSTSPLKQKAIDFYGMRKMVENKTQAPGYSAK